MGTILLTGGTGFAGRCLIEDILKYTDHDIISLQRKYPDTTTNDRVMRITWDFREEYPPLAIHNILVGLKYFIHLGAEVHALRSLQNPIPFVQANVLGTANVLELARKICPECFVYVSTAQVLGGRDEGYSLEDDRLMPSNPYAATKAAGELLTYSYFRAFDLPAIIVRTMNLWGEGQNDETKFVPMVQKLIRDGKPVKIHVRNGKPGVRQWIQGSNFARQLMDLIPQAEFGQTYHILGEELTNLEMATRVVGEMRKELKCEMTRISKTHAFRYALQRSR
jgi:dTDP-glucose 4,6-dehydratase